MRKFTDEEMMELAGSMDYELREQVHSELAPCSNEAFMERYLELDPSFVSII